MKIYLSTVLSCLIVLICQNVFSQNGVGVNTNTPLSSFEDNGSFGKVATTITASTTLNATHASIICNNGSTAIAVTLPAANTCSGRIYEIKRNAASTALVTVTATIDGVTNYLLSYANQSVTVFSDGTNWQSRDGAGDSWKLAGNAGTVASTNFLGTTDGIDLVFRANNSERMRILGSGATVGNVGIGTTTPRGNTFEVSAAGGDPQIYFSNRANNSINRDITTNYAFDDGIGASIYAKRNSGSTFSNAFLRFAVAGNQDRMNVLSTGAEVFQNVFVQGALGTTTEQLRMHNDNVDSYIDYTGGNLTFRDNGSGSALFLEDATGEIGIGTATPKSLLEINGSFGKKVTITATDLTLNGTHSTIVCTNAGVARTLTLPAAAGVTGRIYEIKKDASSTGNITLSGGGNIDGAASLVITGINTAVTIFSDGTEWKTMQGGSSQNGTAWTILGNVGTVASTNFIGTTDAIDFVTRTNGTEKMRVLSGGNVGIGTPAPTSLLHLFEATGTVPSATSGTLRLEHNDVGGTSSILFKSKQDPTSDFGYISYSDDGSGNGSSAENSLLTIGVGNNGSGAFQDDIAIMPSGNVGIGNTAPLQKLHVSGNIQLGDEMAAVEVGKQLMFSNNYNNTDPASIYRVNTAGDNSVIRFELGDNYGDLTGQDFFDFCAFDGTATPALRIVTNNSNVGINAPTPTSRLHVIASDEIISAGVVSPRTATYAGTFLSNISTSTTANIVKKGLEVTSTGTWSGATASNIGIHVSSVTGGTVNYDAIFNGGGNVGIFTQTPKSNLEVNGSFGADVVTTIGNLTLDDTHHIVIILGAHNITLPAANTCANRIYHITNTTGTARTITSYNDLANVASTLVPINTGISIVSDGTTWRRFR